MAEVKFIMNVNKLRGQDIKYSINQYTKYKEQLKSFRFQEFSVSLIEVNIPSWNMQSSSNKKNIFANPNMIVS